jgi:hypothetical protein
LPNCFYGSAGKNLCRRIFIYNRLFVAHFVAPISAFAWFAAAFFTVAPRLALLQLLAVLVVFSTYFEGCVSVI